MSNTPGDIPSSQPTGARSVAEVADWLIGRLAEELRTGRDKVPVDQPIYSFGIDSVQVVSIVAELEDWGGFRFSENPLDEHPTIESLAQFVAELTQRGG